MSYLHAITGPVAVIGIGATGRSVVRYLEPHIQNICVFDNDPGAEAISTLVVEFPHVRTCFGDFDWTYIESAQYIVMSPGVCPYHPMWQAHHRRKMISDIELFARAVSTPVLAITGSNGKSTVAALLAHTLKKLGYRVALGANFGPPALDLLRQSNLDYIIVELSSFQLALTKSLKPFVATLLNYSPDHLDWHPDMQDYLEAKQRIFSGAQHIVVNREAPETYCHLDPVRISVGFSSQIPQYAQDFGLRMIDGEYTVIRGNKALVKQSVLAAPLTFQLLNHLAVFAMLDCLSIPTASYLPAIVGFQGLQHRCVYVGHYSGKDWYNDSKATNSAAMLAAVSGLASRYADIILLAGGVWKEQVTVTFPPELIPHIQGIILFGRDAKTLYTMWHEQYCCVMVEDLNAAVAYAAAISAERAAVILSPACASFDQFAHYQQRGTDFVNIVKNSTAK